MFRSVSQSAASEATSSPPPDSESDSESPTPGDDASTSSSFIRNLQKLTLNTTKPKPKLKPKPNSDTLVIKPLPKEAASRTYASSSLSPSKPSAISAQSPRIRSHTDPATLSPHSTASTDIPSAISMQSPRSHTDPPTLSPHLTGSDDTPNMNATFLDESPELSASGDSSPSKRMKRAQHLHRSMQKTLKLSVAAMKSSSDLGNMRKTVQVPENESREEWIVVNANAFLDAAIEVYGECSRFCTHESCPKMSAGGRYTYLWADGVRVPKPIPCSAPEYIEYLFEWADDHLSVDMPEDPKEKRRYLSTTDQVLKRLFRLYAHIYHYHYDKLCDIGAESKLNFNFRHLVYFITEFNLVREAELLPLERLIRRFAPKAFDK